MNEDLVPFEVAVKLKETGFPQNVLIGYDEFGALCIGDEYSIVCAAPTISQVLKWLREEKKMHIIVEISDSGWYYTLYPNIRWENGILKSDKYIMSFKHKASYEQAALAGIGYVLDKLL